MSISDLPEDSLALAGLDKATETVRKTPGLETFTPSHLVITGYRSTMADNHHTYLTLPASMLYEEFRAQLLANHLMNFSQMAATGESLEQVAKSKPHTGMGNLDNKIELYNDFFLKVEDERLIPALIDGSLDDFIDLGVETLGYRGLVRAKKSFDRLEHQAQALHS